MKIGIIGAMDEEIAIIKKEMNIYRSKNKAGMFFLTGKFSGIDVVLVRSGIGKVNAAICTQVLIDDFNIDMVINTGIAGGVKEVINPGDVVISTDLVHHDMDTSAFGDEIGQVPRMDTFSFMAHEKLVDLAFSSAKKLKGYNVYKGRIISGDQFIADTDKIMSLRERFNAYAVEMEGAGIAHTCYVNGIPFVVIRSISDRADSNIHMDYATFKNIAINNSIGILKNMFENMQVMKW